MIKEFGKIPGTILYLIYLGVIAIIQIAAIIFLLCLLLSVFFYLSPSDILHGETESMVKQLRTLGIKCFFVIVSGFISILGLKHIAVKYKKWL